MSLKNRKTFIALTLQLISLFFISCSDHKLKLNTEELENCARWNWIALTDTKKWSKKAEAYFTYVPGKKIRIIIMWNLVSSLYFTKFI